MDSEFTSIRSKGRVEFDPRELLEQAKNVLAGNWVGGHTKPSPELYPHQWSWDSGFIAFGYAHYDQERAQREMLSLFRGHRFMNPLHVRA